MGLEKMIVDYKNDTAYFTEDQSLGMIIRATHQLEDEDSAGITKYHK